MGWGKFFFVLSVGFSVVWANNACHQFKSCQKCLAQKQCRYYVTEMDIFCEDEDLFSGIYVFRVSNPSRCSTIEDDPLPHLIPTPGGLNSDNKTAKVDGGKLPNNATRETNAESYVNKAWKLRFISKMCAAYVELFGGLHPKNKKINKEYTKCFNRMKN